MEGWRNFEQAPPGSLDYTFLRGAPLSLIEYATPEQERERLKASLGLFAQDQWTIKRLTLNLGLRYDYLNAFAAATNLPAGPFVPARNFPEVTCLPCWSDINPRLGAAYDLFGNGRTALKVNIGRYVAGQAVDIASALHPVNASVYSTARTWNDGTYPVGDPRRQNYVPDCDLTNALANGECGQIDNLNFGRNNPNAIRYASDVLTGWGHRGYNWQASAALQHELRPGIALNLAYFRTWYGNFTVTENTSVTAADFTQYCITSPTDSRLPAGGGNQICGNYDVSPTKFGQVQNLVELASHYGDQSEVYNGIDLTLNARLKGLYVSGGMNTGRTETNVCDIVMRYPQVTGTVSGSNYTFPRNPTFCDNVFSWAAQTQIKFGAIYNLPWDMQTSATMQHYPGVTQNATVVATNPQIAPSLGRNLAAGPNATATINIVPPNVLFEDRYTQFDLRFAKGVKIARSHVIGILDLFNAFNARPVLAVNTRYSTSSGGAWLTPTSTLVGRLIKFSAQVNF